MTADDSGFELGYGRLGAWVSRSNCGRLGGGIFFSRCFFLCFPSLSPKFLFRNSQYKNTHARDDFDRARFRLCCEGANDDVRALASLSPKRRHRSETYDDAHGDNTDHWACVNQQWDCLTIFHLFFGIFLGDLETTGNLSAKSKSCCQRNVQYDSSTRRLVRVGVLIRFNHDPAKPGFGGVDFWEYRSKG